MACRLGFYGDGISFRVVFSQSFRLKSPSWWCTPCSAKMNAREDSGRWLAMWCLLLNFPELFCWWRLISSVFLTRTSSHKTTHANGYYGAWPGRVVSISVLPLTVLQCWGKTDRGVCVCVCVCYADRGRKQGPTFTRIICLSPLGRGDTSEDRKVT